MPRPDPALLDPARYPFCCTIEPRFGDLDVNRHINNVAMAGILEDGRVRFHRARGIVAAMAGLSSMVASLAIEYVGQTHYPDPLTVHVAPLRIGGSSYSLAQLVTQSGQAAVYAETVLVCVGSAGPAALPQAWRNALETAMIRA